MAAVKEYYTIKLHDTDAAGILFFANQFRIVHDVYETFLGRIGYPFQKRFTSNDFYIPIVHADGDFRSPLTVGDTVEISLDVASVGDTSFTLEYRLTGLDGEIVGTARTVHVTIDPGTGQKIDIPDPLRNKLEDAIQSDAG